MRDYSWESFIYGNTCTVARNPSERPLTAPKGSFNFKELAVHISLVAATFSPTFETRAFGSTGNVAQGGQRRHFLHRANLDWTERLRRARKTLSLTLEETADFLDVSLSTLQKLEAGDTEKPQKETLQKYSTLIEIESLLKKKLDNRRFAIVSALRTKLSAFGGLNALEFAKRTRPDGVEAVLGILKRIHA